MGILDVLKYILRGVNRVRISSGYWNKVLVPGSISLVRIISGTSRASSPLLIVLLVTEELRKARIKR
jgi:hypothetical protein